MAFSTQVICVSGSFVKVSSGDTTSGFLADKLAAGANITLTILNPGGNEQLEIAAVTGGFSIEVPTGSVDGSNTAFTVLNTPKGLVIDGIVVRQNHGYTLSGLNIVTDNPPVVDIFSLY